MKKKLVKEDIVKFSKYRNLLKEFNDIKTFFNYIKQQVSFWKSAPANIAQDAKDSIHEVIVGNINEFEKVNFSIGEEEEMLGYMIMQFLRTYSNIKNISNPDNLLQGINEIEQLMYRITVNAQQLIKGVNPNLKSTTKEELEEVKNLLIDYKVFRKNLEIVNEVFKYIGEIALPWMGDIITIRTELGLTRLKEPSPEVIRFHLSQGIKNREQVIQYIQDVLEAFRGVEFTEDFYDSKDILLKFLEDNSKSSTFDNAFVFYRRFKEPVKSAILSNRKRVKTRMEELKQKIQQLEMDIQSLAESKK